MLKRVDYRIYPETGTAKLTLIAPTESINNNNV